MTDDAQRLVETLLYFVYQGAVADGARNRHVVAPRRELRAVLDEYVVWLERQPLAERSRDAYRRRSSSFWCG